MVTLIGNHNPEGGLNVRVRPFSIYLRKEKYYFFLRSLMNPRYTIMAAKDSDTNVQ